MAERNSLFKLMFSLPSNFWYANIMEMFERLAFFGVRAVAPLYLVKSASENGLNLDFAEKGEIYMVWAFLQCLIPMVSGGYTERYGYRKSLVVAFLLNIGGYLGMAYSLPLSNHFVEQGFEKPGYWIFMIAACLVACGTAIFKPPVHGTIAKSTNDETSSMGWGVFYWAVNIGGAFAPMIAAELRGEIDWDIVFYGAAIVTAFNFLPLFLLYKEPEKDPSDHGETGKQGPVGTFVSSILTIFRDLRLVVFLAIFSCFWLMFMQLWDLLPNFVDEWVDTSDIAPAFAWLGDSLNLDWVLENGQVKPEMIININPMSVILLVLIVSWLISRISKIAAMVIGMLISLVGFMGAGATCIGWFCCIMILVFSIGEMTCSPTFSAYVGLIAPKNKKALYMGYSNIPYAIGWALGNKIGGDLYEDMSSKINLARNYLVDHLSMAKEAVTALQNEEVMPLLMERLGTGDASATLRQTTTVLWETYHPEKVWYYLGAVGLAGTLGMLLFYYFTRKSMAKSKASE
ncbi:MAG: MFS transporter, partial [Planctomycetes bacterium]|nr:MFS transporter [Planctomycetota bacterium]